MSVTSRKREQHTENGASKIVRQERNNEGRSTRTENRRLLEKNGESEIARGERRIGDRSRSSTNRTRRYEEESRSSKLSCEYYFDGFPSKTPQPLSINPRSRTCSGVRTRSGRPMTDNPYKLQLWNAFRAPHDRQSLQVTTPERVPGAP